MSDEDLITKHKPNYPVVRVAYLQRAEEVPDMENYEENGTLHETFRRQARKTPDRIAVVTEDGRQMTYKELDNTTDILASWLQTRGVIPDSVVGIYMERCREYAVAYIAILKAGGAYLPLDPNYPKPLLEDIVEDSEPKLIIAQEDLVPNLPGYVLEAGKVLVCNEGWLERVHSELNQCTEPPTRPTVHLDNLSCVVYSSGTTGKPKGIQCPHRGAVFSYSWRAITYPYGDDDKEACNVFFVWEMLRPLQQGATLYIIPDNVIYDPRLLCNYIYKHQITRILFTPSLLEAILDTRGLDFAELLKSVRLLIFCGEVVTVGLLERCMNLLGHIKFINLYSISEAHDVACADLSEWFRKDKMNALSKKFCPVGQLLPGVSVVIMDDGLRPQPVGVPGEIYIGGPTLARGYLNKPELDKERFIRCPPGVSVPGDRLYKAGDWGYMLSDGSFEICGRCDSMVKIRGYSIETQAVETALLDLPLVNACVVLTVGKEGEDKHLVAYIVPEANATKKEVRAALKKRLPFYMIPSYFVFLNNIPILASSGKLNKKALPDLDNELSEEDQEGRPSTDTERKLERLWAEVLQQKHVDVQESFFDLGGHSLLATKLLNKVMQAFNVELTVKDLFVHSTISSMANLLEQHDPDKPCHKMSIAPELNLLMEVDTHDQALLGMDIQLRAFWRSMQVKDKWLTGRVLLTGATGFLGVFLLKDLLQNTKSQIFCIVRELPNQSGMDRILKTMKQYGMLEADSEQTSNGKMSMEAQTKSRVTVFNGDVGLMNMGLSEEDYTYLCMEIDYIIHAAAHVNLIYPYEALRGPNVLGTENIVKFACTSKIKPIHYISTDAVFPNGLTDCREDADMAQYVNKLEGGYSQSKWVAEQLVKRAMDRGLPAVIYRLGNLSGETTKAFWNPEDFNLLMIKGCIALKSAPDIDWNIEMTPVNFVSHFIVTLVQNMSLALGKVFHVINPHTLKSGWLYEWMLAHGYQVKVIPFEEWKERVEKTKESVKEGAMLARLLDTMIKEETYFSQLSTYRQDTLNAVLKTLNLTYPVINSSILETYFSNLSKRGIIPEPQKTKMDHQLAGCVAIVTGASSGIGAAIARHLALAGAHVALAARRKEKLEDIKREIEKEGGVVIAVKCDVTNREEVKSMVHHTESTLGPVDILVNNAGVMYYTMMKNLKEDQWERQVDLNCKGVLNCIGAVLDGMIKRGKGHIVNISSDAGRSGFAGLAVYSGTKFFVEGLSQGLRLELAKSGIKVTCIQPGDVKTELQSRSTDHEAKDAYDMSGKVTILLPEDIANAVVYATTQPPYAAVNEILIQPRESPI